MNTTAKSLTKDSFCFTYNSSTDFSEFLKAFQTFFKWAVNNLKAQ
ncbi:2391_t:CDS:2 [Funneliformis mosseae]|uniref:2391_t:CDS:1 n=1 Tax=Funneliformis mosseae TaxID=27381 RepID=A0A9N9FLZ0_FUNMO|nr:2391_t:CDS:2 [Funneliformis mosseae]